MLLFRLMFLMRNKKLINNQGFTLIELLLGCSMFALIGACILSTFWGGVGLSRRSKKIVDGQFHAKIIFDRIARECENMVPYDFSYSYPTRKAFIGNKERLVFLKPTKEGLVAVQYYMQAVDLMKVHQKKLGVRSSRNVNLVLNQTEDFTEVHLLRREIDFKTYCLSGFETVQRGEVISHLSNLDVLTFSFGHLNQEGHNAIDWQPVWGSSDIPLKVRIEIILANQQKLVKEILIPIGVLGVRR